VNRVNWNQAGFGLPERLNRPDFPHHRQSVSLKSRHENQITPRSP
jgi:hypothetical protein